MRREHFLAGLVAFIPQTACTNPPLPEPPQRPGVSAARTAAPTPSQFDLCRAEKDRLDRALVSMDRSMGIFTQALDIIKGNMDEPLRQALLAPLELYDYNKTNPQRNADVRLCADIQARGQQAITSVRPTPTFTDPRYFSIDFLPQNQTGNLAEHHPFYKTLLVSEALFPPNPVDTLVLYQQFEHVRQDIDLRNHIKGTPQEGAYIQFLTQGETKRLAVNFEYEAYFKQIFLLDVLSDGRLERDVQNSLVNITNYANFLNARPEQVKNVEFMLTLARHIFSEQLPVGQYPTSYTEFLNRYYRDQGYNLYTISPEGAIARIQ